MPRVLHTAQALVDHVIEVPAAPAPGDNTNASRAVLYAGGAVNTLLAAARAGARAVHGGAHGTGPHGDLIRAALTAEDVTLSDRPVPDEDTGECIVLLEPSAERTFITVYGAERRVSAASLARLDPRHGDLVCFSGYSLYPPTRDPLLTFLGTLDPGVGLVLDPGAPFARFPAEPRDIVLARTTVWTSNAEEARELTGLDDLAACAAAIRDRLPREDAVVVVRDGARGCLVLEAGTVHEVPGFPQVPVDTNGAGDAHTGVLLAERTLGTAWPEAARRANAAAGIAVTRPGPATSPSRAEVDALLAATDAPATAHAP